MNYFKPQRNNLFGFTLLMASFSMMLATNLTTDTVTPNQDEQNDQAVQTVIDQHKQMQLQKTKYSYVQRFNEYSNLNESINQRRETPPKHNQFSVPELSWDWLDQKPYYDHTNTNDSRTDSINIVINELDADSIVQGDDFSLTVYFADGIYEADVSTWFDMDGDGVFNDAVDFDFDEYNHIVDNSPEDQNDAVGIYQEFFSGNEDGPNRVSNILIFFIVDDGVSTDVASLFIEPIDSPYSFSGHVEPAEANIIIMAMPMNDNGGDQMPWMTVTNQNGDYQNFIPDPGIDLWVLMAFDFLNITGGMVADTSYFDINVMGHEVGFNFNFYLPTSGLEGNVVDENGYPLFDVEVWADMDGPGISAYTDSSGYFMMSLDNGEWRIGLNEWGLIPDYLVPNDMWVEIYEDDTLWIEIIVPSTDAIISGTVFLDGMPWNGTNIHASSPIGWTNAPTETNGIFVLNVSTYADQFGGYQLDIDWNNLPPNVMVDQMPQMVLSGTSGADIYLSTVSGGIQGFVFDATTQNPVQYAWVQAQNDMGGNGTGTWDDGSYYLPLPNGTYTINVGGDGYFVQSFDQVVIQDNFIPMDFFLQPFTIDGILSGYVYDIGGSVLQDVEVNVGNDMFWQNTWTDGSGYYEFELPNGMYGIHAHMDGFIDEFDMIEINDGNAQHDFYLQQIIINAAIEGYVIDGNTGNPVIGADVFAFGSFYEGYAMSSTGGYFFMDVPSDTFWVTSHAPGFGNSEHIQIFVNENEIVQVTLELYQPTSTPPQIMGIFDVPNDQGKQVHIAWQPGQPEGDMPWNQFSIWRHVANTDFPPLWDYIATVPFHGMEPYSMVVPTLVDSNHITGPTGQYMSTFRVTGHTYNPWDYADSESGIGYSMDNLHPMPPAGFNATVEPGNGAIVLNWRHSHEEDFSHYTLYRYIDGTNFSEIGMMGDTMYVDTDISSGHEYTYELIASDFNGNESDPSSTSTEVLSIIVGAEIPDVYALSQNYPNPFNPTTELRYDLPEDGFVSVVVYNTLGREVDQLVFDHQPAGQYHVIWSAKDQPSGLYFVRMQTDSFSKTRKMMLIK